MKSKTTAVWITMLIAGACVGAVTAYVRSTPSLPQHQTPTPEPEVVSSFTPHKDPIPKQAQTISVFVPTMGVDGIAFTKQESTVPEGMDPKLFAVNEFLRASQIASPNAEALNVDLRNGTAIISFNKEFEATYGTFDEKKMIDGLASTLGQFPDVNAVAMEINGEQLKTLGSADLTDPIPVIRPDTVPTKPTQSPPPDDTTSPPKP